MTGGESDAPAGERDLVVGATQGTRWRRRAEDAIRCGGLDCTIVRSGILSDAPAGQRAIEIGQYPMSLKCRIGREDVAEVFVQALRRP